MTSFTSCQPQQLFTPLSLPPSRPANFQEGGREGAEKFGVSVWAGLGAGDGYEGVDRGFERASDPRGLWPADPAGDEGELELALVSAAAVGDLLLEAVGRVIPGRLGCLVLLEVKPGGEKLCFSLKQHSTDTFLMSQQGIQIAPF